MKLLMCHYSLLLVCLLSVPSLAQDFQSHVYHQTDSTYLELDLFLPDEVSGAKSLVIFVHGGGFCRG